MSTVVRQAGEVRSARIEGLRALAALSVLVAHAFGEANHYDPVATLGDFGDRVLLGGGFGVFLFFALSGYLLYLPFARRDFGGGEPVRLGRYLANRALRILPLYYVVLAVMLVLRAGGGTAHQWLLFGTFSQNFTSDPTVLNDVDGVMWSLATEVRFYVVLPLVALGVAWCARRSPRRAAVALGVLGLGSFALRFVTMYAGGGPVDPLVDYSLTSTFMFFVAGMLVALARVAWEERPPARVSALARADLWLAGSVGAWLLVAVDYRLGWLAAPASALLLGACVLPLRPTPLLRAFADRRLAALGIVSYSIYLWHLPLMEWLAERDWLTDGTLPLLAATLPGTLALSFASYRYVEAPSLRRRRAWGATAARTAEAPPEGVLTDTAAPGHLT